MVGRISRGTIENPCEDIPLVGYGRALDVGANECGTASVKARSVAVEGKRTPIEIAGGVIDAYDVRCSF